MKYIITGLFLICLISCDKDPNAPAGANTSGSISYKVNGNDFTIDNVDVLSGQYAIVYKYLQGTVYSDTRYAVQGQKGVNNLVMFYMFTDSLQKTNYRYDSAYVFSTGKMFYNILYNGQQSSILRKGDYFDINVTQYANGKISGTFTAKLTPFTSTTIGAPGSTIITEGKLTNVQVVY